jgi:hypothetical protein
VDANILYNKAAAVMDTIKGTPVAFILITAKCNSSSSSPPLGATALREPWPPLLFASPGLYPELSFSILQSLSLVSPLEHHLAAECN